MAWNGIGSTVGQWREGSNPYMLRKSSMHVHPIDSRAKIKFSQPIT